MTPARRRSCAAWVAPGCPRWQAPTRARPCTVFCGEYIPGETLDKAARGRMTEAQARQIGLSLCRVLRRLHSQDAPIIHRDIKPQNVVLGEDGRVWLIDFDISRRYSRGAPADTVISGTQDFAAPEQYGFSQTDCRSDIFSH